MEYVKISYGTFKTMEDEITLLSPPLELKLKTLNEFMVYLNCFRDMFAIFVESFLRFKIDHTKEVLLIKYGAINVIIYLQLTNNPRWSKFF